MKEISSKEDRVCPHLYAVQTISPGIRIIIYGNQKCIQFPYGILAHGNEYASRG